MPDDLGEMLAYCLVRYYQFTVIGPEVFNQFLLKGGFVESIFLKPYRKGSQSIVEVPGNERGDNG
jgi:hypothetical protein